MYILSCIGRVIILFLGIYCVLKYVLELLVEGYCVEFLGFGIEFCIIELGGMLIVFMGGMLWLSDEIRNEGYGDMVYVLDVFLKGYVDYIKINL